MTDSAHIGFLGLFLRNLPYRYKCRWSEKSAKDLRRALFESLIGDDPQYWTLLFPDGEPDDFDKLSLSTAQDNLDGVEYSEAARGRPCGHIFKHGETTYSCKTCALDETCVLCVRCFQHSDHQDHNISVGVSQGSSSCCDCGDDEAWTQTVCCDIHSAERAPQSAKSTGKAPEYDTALPDGIEHAVHSTIAMVIDYTCDVFACCPEQQRTPKTLQSVREDEQRSRLKAPKYHNAENDPPEPAEWAMVLWNDEKHTVYDVQEMVARACKARKSFGLKVANEVHARGRCIVKYDTDLSTLLSMTAILEQIQLSVTVRSARDVFREEMCGTMIDWLNDIANCRIGRNSAILRSAISLALLEQWQLGSPHFKVELGRAPMYDHEAEEQDFPQRSLAFARGTLGPVAQLRRIIDETETNNLAAIETGEDQGTIDDENLGTGQDNMFGGMDLGMNDAQVATLDVTEAAGALRRVMADQIFTLTRGRETPDVDMEEDTADQERLNRPPVSHAQERIAPNGDPLMEVDANALETPRDKAQPPHHWLEGRESGQSNKDLATESLAKRLRIDCLIVCDMRLWKDLRGGLRDLYIRTLIVDPEHKRLLALRLAALFTDLSRIFLVADRESDHSIMTICVQLFTTPSITADAVDHSNLFTKLLAILFTFTTTRKVGYPEDVAVLPFEPIEASVASNKRFSHLIYNLRYLLQSDRVQQRLRDQPPFLLQFLDYAQLHQNIWPTTRAVDEHVHFEMDGAHTTQDMVVVLNQFCRLFAQSFTSPDDHSHIADHRLLDAVHHVARFAIVNSLSQRDFQTSNFKQCISFEVFESRDPVFCDTLSRRVALPACRVLTHAMSFHHPIHNFLAWLLLACKDMPRQQVQAALSMIGHDIAATVAGWADTDASPLLEVNCRREVDDPSYVQDCYLSALFDIPLRVCVWASQIRAKLWVRNGFSLRQQLSNYRSSWLREFTVQRDHFMLQAGLILCRNDGVASGESFLFQMIRRFDMLNLLHGTHDIPSGYERSQQLEIIEDFYLLLTAVLCEREELIVNSPPARALQRDIAHALCFKPLTFSAITARMPDKATRRREVDFDEVLGEMTTYKAPEGVSDHGTFELRDHYFDMIDPFYLYYSRNQREEAEHILKRRLAAKTGIALADTVIETALPHLESGLFQALPQVLNSRLFLRIISLPFELGTPKVLGIYSDLTPSKLEPIISVALHLLLVAIMEDTKSETDFASEPSITDRILAPASEAPVLLQNLRSMAEDSRFASSHARIRRIMQLLPSKRPALAAKVGIKSDNEVTIMATVNDGDSDKEARKQAALARQARIMAQFKQQQSKFMSQQGMDWGVSDDDIEMAESTSQDTATVKLVPYPSEPCMLCQEETNDERLYGTLASVEISTIFRMTPDYYDRDSIICDDYLGDLDTVPQNLDRSAEAQRPFRHPAASHNDNILLPSMDTTPRSPGPVSTSCGHMMHFSCFQEYVNSIELRHSSQIARSHPEDIHRKQFLCPLCKAVGNLFLPIVVQGHGDCSAEELSSAPDTYDAWMSENHAWLSGNQAADLAKQEAALSPADSLQTTSKAYLESRLSPAMYKRVLGITQRSQQGLLPGDPNMLMRDLTRSAIEEAMPRVIPGELIGCYARLHKSLHINAFILEEDADGLDCDSPQVSAHCGILGSVLAHSIIAQEIACRGVESGPSCLSAISAQNHMNLCILSDTIDSYRAIRALEAEQQEVESLPASFYGGMSIFAETAFVQFVDCSTRHPKLWNDQSQHILRLCYTIQVVGSILMTLECDKRKSKVRVAGEVCPILPHGLKDLCATLERVTNKDNRVRVEDDPTLVDMIWRHMQPYALVFLRQSLIFMNVRRGINFASAEASVDPALPELERLTKLLGLPDLGAMITHIMSDSAGGRAIRELIVNEAAKVPRVSHDGIELDYPGVYELAPLPQTYDTLSEAVFKLRCPTLSGPIRDPTMCLMCGEVFCGQADCCGLNGGGASRHMAS